VEKTNAWLTLITNLGVIGGLIILVYEVQQNTQALENETDVAVYSMAMENRQMLVESSELRDLYVRVETESWNDFTPEEQMTLLGYWSNELDRSELQFLLFKRNQTDLDNIIFFERDLSLEAFRTAWLAWKKYFDPEFVAYFDNYISEASDR
jgi:hypothetical protein